MPFWQEESPLLCILKCMQATERARDGYKLSVLYME